MNKKLIISFAFFISSSFLYDYAQEKNGVYEYPVKPGSEQWKAFTNHIEMINSCQIPNSILPNMTTEDLIQTCLNYPLYGDMFCYNYIQQGFNAVFTNFNGLQELFQRKDAGLILLKKYKNMAVDSFEENGSLLDKGKYASKLYSLEILIAQETILSQLQKDQKKQLIEECIKKSEEKSKYSEVYGMLSYMNIVLILGRVLTNENYEPLIQKIEVDKRTKSFLEQGSILDPILFDEILNFSINYITKR